MREGFPSRDAVYVFGPFLLLPARRALLRNGQAVRLGRRAFDLLLALVERANEVVGKSELVARAWPDLAVDEGTLRIHVAGLRKALGESGEGPRYVANVPSRGYCFMGHVTRCEPSAACAPASAAMPQAAGPRLIGRADVLDALARALPGHRLVTVTGSGGMGKTSVASAVAMRLARHYAHGVHLVDLAAVDDAALVPATVAATLGMPAARESDVSDLAAWVASRAMLLVLDNCEHLLSAVADLVAALLRAPRLHVLATSRQPLNLPGEWVERLPALTAPPVDMPLCHAQAMAFPAFELFVDRATASFDGIHLSDADAPGIAALCHQLDGVPLAIELAASQIGFYGLGGLRAMLDDRSSLSAMSRRTAQPRHQSLRGMLDWSYRLLSPQEQRVLCQLSVFRERFGLHSAVRIAGDRACNTADALVGLVEKSLVSMEQEGDEPPHYRLLAITRSFAAEQLAADPAEMAATSRRHVGHCIEAAQMAALDTRMPFESWRARHGRCIDDVRAALGWALDEGGDVPQGCRLAIEAASMYAALGLGREHMQWLERALKQMPADPEHAGLRMQALLEYGHAGTARQDDFQDGITALERGAALARERGDAGAELGALNGLFQARVLQSRHDAALEVAQRFESVASTQADAAAAMVSHRLMGVVLYLRGDAAAAEQHVRLALQPGAHRVGRLHGHPTQLEHCTAVHVLEARLRWWQGLPDQAAQAAEAAVEAAMAARHPPSQAYALALAACPVALWRGDRILARRRVDELERCAERHGLLAWQGWAPWYRHAAEKLGLAAPSPMPADSPWPAQAELLATLHPDLAHDEPLEFMLAGHSPWCEPEVLRAAGERLATRGREGDLARAEALLRTALAQAQQQGAQAWSLRCATSLARLQFFARPAGAALLADVLARFTEGEGTRDVCEARAVLQRAQAAATASGLKTV